MKRGASQAVIFVLLIGFAITSAVLVINWSTKQTKDLTSSGVDFVEETIECDKVAINVRDTSEEKDCSELIINNKGRLKIEKAVLRAINDNEMEIIPIIKIDGKLIGCKEKSLYINCQGDFSSESIIVGGSDLDLMPGEETSEQIGICVPDTCDSLGYICGSYDDDCEGTIECGPCGSNEVCSDGACSCNENYVDCDGSSDNGCECYVGGTNSCIGGECVCIPKICDSMDCGYISDECTGMIYCGGCPLGYVCRYGKCIISCIPKTCGYMDCGYISDGCTGMIYCGGCPWGYVCQGTRCVFYWYDGGR